MEIFFKGNNGSWASHSAYVAVAQDFPVSLPAFQNKSLSYKLKLWD